MSVVDILETEFRLKDNYSGAAKNVTASTQGLSQVMGGASMVSAGFTTALAVATAGLAAMGVVAAGAFAAMKEGAAFENLQISLKAVEGNATSAAEAMKRLKEIAKNPGIGFEEAVRGYSGLRRGGASADLSERIVASAGNANAYAGGDVQKFDQIMRAFSQILNKPYLQGDELLQLSEAGLPGSKMIRDKFGTADGAELKKMGVTSAMAVEALVEAMEKLPKVAGGSQNALDNFNDAIKFAVVDFGQALNTSFMPVLSSISDELSKLVEDGYFATLGEEFARLTMSLTDGNPGAKLRDVSESFSELAATLGGLVETLKAVQHFIDNYTPYGMVKRAAGNFYKGAVHEPERGDSYSKEMFDKAQEENAPFLQQQLDRIKAEEKTRKDAEKEAEAKKEKEDSPAVRVLKKIEENTKVMPDLKEAIMGGGELARLGVSAVDIGRGKARREKVVRNLEIMAFEGASSMNRRMRRAGV
jgi:tape measure domain-containing protein